MSKETKSSKSGEDNKAMSEGAQGKEAASVFAMKKPTDPSIEKFIEEHSRLETATAMALAILRNPSIERFCYGSPLDPHTCGDHPNVGSFLAARSLQLADDYRAALDARSLVGLRINPTVKPEQEPARDEATADSDFT